MKLFSRKIKLEIFHSGPADNPKSRYRAQKTTIEGLDINFDVVSSIDSDPNQAKIVVYNLAKETRDKIQTAHLGVKLYAGYGEDVALIFSGTTNNIIHTKEGVDWVTTIYSGDGEKEYLAKKFNKSYKEGTKISKIIDDLAWELEMSLVWDSTKFNQTLLLGASYVGLVKDVLNNLANEYDFTWYILDEAIEIFARGENQSRYAFVPTLRADTGMIGSPSKVIWTEPDDKEKAEKKRSEKNKEVDDTEKAVGVTALLNPEIKPGRLIKIEAVQSNDDTGKLFKGKNTSSDLNGVYVCERVHYFGSNYGVEYYVEVEAKLNEA